MHYLFIGNDKKSLDLRDAKLADLKASLFPSPDALRFDLEELDGKKVSAERLKMSLISLPALAKKRLVIIRQADKLSKECGELLKKAIEEDDPKLPVFVLETEDGGLKAELRKVMEARGQKIGFIERKASVFDMMERLGDIAWALKMLNKLFDDAESPEQLLGGMIWAWSNKWKTKVSADRYKKGLLVLQEADHHLKRSKFPERGYALEVALVKLSSLLKA